MRWVDVITENEDSISRAASAGFDTSTVWYHGTKYKFDHFSYDHVGKGNDQLGSGFYFTTDRDAAVGYTEGNDPIIHAVFLRFRKEVSRRKPLSRSAIRALIAGGDPDALYNFGDVEFDGLEATLRTAIDAYADLPAFDAMISLSNDFYRGIEGKFLTIFVKETGCNHVMEHFADGSRNCVIFDPRDIKSVDAQFMNLDSDHLLS